MDARPSHFVRVVDVDGETERAEEGVLGRLHELEEVREVHDAGHVGVRELDLADDPVLVAHEL